MAQWVEYLTMDGRSPMSDLRARNGRKEPWPVKFWGVGNENWGCGGNMRPEYYADLYRQYATYCRNFGSNRLFKIAGGANSFDYNWTDVLMRQAADRMDGLSLHYYTSPGDWNGKKCAVDFNEADWLLTMESASKMEELVSRHSAIMDKYDPQRRVALVVDEWGTWFKVEPGSNPGFLYQQNTMRDALVAGITLNIFNRHAERVRMANIAQTVNVLQAMVLTEGDKLLLTPSYHVFEMYRGHHDAILLPCHVDSPRLSGGKDAIAQLSASASKSDDGSLLITLCNLDCEKDLEVSCQVRGMLPSKGSARILTSKDMHGHNSFDAPRSVLPESFDGFTQKGGNLRISLPSKSVMALTLS